MGDWIELAGTDARAWRSTPERGDGPGVLVLHAWWGLNETIRAIADRLGSEGFVAVAPDLYGGRVVNTIQAAESAADALDGDAARAVVSAAVTHVRGDDAEVGRGIGVVGFSLGASFALRLAATDPGVDAVVLYYGTGGEFDWSSSRAAFLGHFAERDPFEEPAYVSALRDALAAAGREVRFETYPGTSHWFAEPDRPEYDERSAGTAWERTVAFLRENLGPIGA